MVTEQGEKELQKALVHEYSNKRLEIFKRNRWAVAEKLNNQALKLQSIYPDCQDYWMFHVLIGDTHPPCEKFDFPGEDSVIAFLDGLEKEFPEKS